MTSDWRPRRSFDIMLSHPLHIVPTSSRAEANVPDTIGATSWWEDFEDPPDQPEML